MNRYLQRDANNIPIQRASAFTTRGAVRRLLLALKVIADHVATLTTSVAHGFAVGQRVVLATIAAAKLTPGGQPANNKLVMIGVDTYQFKTAPGEGDPAPQVTDDGYIGVLIGDTQAASILNLVAAINGAAEGGVILRSDGETDALCTGTQAVVAVAGATTVSLFNADAPGGNPLAGSQDLALDTDLAAGAWDIGNGESMSVSEYFDGEFVIADVPSPTSFTFAVPAPAVAASLSAGAAESAAASPLASDTSAIALVWPENAIGLRIRPATQAVQVSAGANQDDGYATAPAGAWFELPGKGGDTVLLTRTLATAVEIIWETLD